MKNKTIGRSLLLYTASDQLRLDKTTREAMPYLEIFIEEMSNRELTWDQVPKDFDFDALFGGIIRKRILQALRRQNGFQVVEAAINDPSLRTPLLANYVRVIEIATPGETANIVSTLKYLGEDRT